MGGHVVDGSATPVRQERSGVLEHHDTVAEQTPPLPGVEGHE
jgi:hypothetical protein